ncbi:MAG: carbamate kinase [Dehalococcoidia bacterium]|nr:carbamate kinase [Dehalococcoidia bacterium]
MLIVAALGGNALLRRGEPPDQSVQQANIARAVEVMADLARAHDLVVTHGNGPQVGLLALAQESYREARPYGLDVLGAETQGMIGYLLEDALRDALPGREVATLLTQVEVDRDDPAFAHPTKPIGPMYTEAQARALEAERGWAVARDGEAYRRVVPSPEPIRIVELAAIRALAARGFLVVCAGGGGVPVYLDERGASFGVEGVVDKDLTSALLARELGADALLLLTDVDAVHLDWGSARARRVRYASPAALRAVAFEPGTMAPKVEAACRVAEATGRTAYIGSLDDAAQLLEGTAGTAVSASATALACWEDEGAR